MPISHSATEITRKGSTLLSRLASACFFLSHEHRLLRLSGSPSGRSESADDAPKFLPVLVVSRSCYQELWEQFPIRSERALRNILKQREQKELEMHYVGPFVDGQRQVLTVRIQQRFAKTLQSAWVVIPETLLIARCAADERSILNQVTNCDGTYYLLTRSQSAWQSVRQSAVLRDAQAAHFTLGANEQTKTQIIDAESHLQFMRHGLQALTWKDWQQSLRPFSASTQSQISWPAMLVAASVVAVVYSGLSSFYLQHQVQSRQQQLQALSQQLDSVVQQRNQLDNEVRLHHEVRSAYGASTHQQMIWDVIASLTEMNLMIQSVRERDGRVLLVADAASATQVLEFLHSYPSVASAEFSSPVRSGPRGSERFSIEISLREAWPNDAE